jgi:hypothetical protein
MGLVQPACISVSIGTLETTETSTPVNPGGEAVEGRPLPAPSVDPDSPTAGESTHRVWKSVLVAGDHSIDAFDNARKSLALLWLTYGLEADDIKGLSARTDEQTNGVAKATIDNLVHALADLNISGDDGCIMHLTSHGSQEGFHLSRDKTLSPRKLASVLDDACGTQPTVVLVSACYSGVFINDDMRADNRIILTAARHDRASFGCSPEAEYTYWDGCLLESFADAVTWSDAYDLTTDCIIKKEGSEFTPSKPQAFFGADVEDLCILLDCDDYPASP